MKIKTVQVILTAIVVSTALMVLATNVAGGYLVAIVSGVSYLAVAMLFALAARDNSAGRKRRAA